MIYRSKWTIKLSKHAEDEAWIEGISNDMIEATSINGRMKWFAKNNVDFVSQYKRGMVICRGQVKYGNLITIMTIMWGDEHEK